MANFNLNRVFLGGRLTADPELKTTQNQTMVTSFSVAVKRRGKDENATDFIDCVAWRERAEFITRYFRKGSSICVEGVLQKRSYTDKQGATRYAVEVNVDNVYFVDSKGESAQAAPQGATYIPEAYLPHDEPSAPATAAPKWTLEDDDDLPF